MLKNCSIVIPVYLPLPSPMEVASFKQVLSVLTSYDVFLITYKELNINVYLNLAKKMNKIVNIVYFDRFFFTSVKSYNDLCLSRDFYSYFVSHYKYMLIYQLDAWVFKDELDYWCNKDYDYIGAPVYFEISKGNFSMKVDGIGNGGFCLRRIQYCLDLLELPQKSKYLNAKRIIRTYYFYCKYNRKFHSLGMKFYALIIAIMKCLGFHNSIFYQLNEVRINEDKFFGIDAIGMCNYKARIPSFEEASHFAFEVHPSVLFKQNKNKLPFGCHAFEKWEFKNFWVNYIKMS